LMIVDDESEAFKMISFGKADGTINNLALGTNLLSNFGLTNVTPTFEIKDKRFHVNLHLATNKNNKYLRNILEKAKSLITEEEAKTLEHKWFVQKNLYDKYRLHFELIKYMLIIAFLIIGLIIYRYFILRKDKLQIEIQSNNLREAQAELKLLASTDPMTKLYNRRYFLETSELLLDLAKRNKTDSSIIIIDIDKFKNINDNYGHKVGDEVIIALTSVLQEHSRKSDIVSRWGGEEFVILLPNTNIDGAFIISEKLREETELLIMNSDGNKVFNFTISLGVAKIKNDIDLNVLDVIARADKALYKAKETGRNKVCIYTDK